MKVSYSTILDLTYPGNGREHARHAILALDRAQALHEAFLFQDPGLSLSTGRVVQCPTGVTRGAWVSRLPGAWAQGYRFCRFDRDVAQRLTPCEVFHVWDDVALASLMRARELGTKVVVERPACHPSHIAQVVQEECACLGIPFVDFDVPAIASRRAQALAEADRVLVPSDYAAKTFTDRAFPVDRLLVQPFGVDLERFCPGDETRSDDTFRLLFIGRVGLLKGFHVLLDAWNRLALDDAELVVCGKVLADGEAIRARFPGARNVRYVGFRDTVELYRQADALCLPSLCEGSALVAYEALACGCPAIVTPACGSIVRDGEDGALVPDRDAAALADCIHDLYQDRPRLQAMRAPARARAEEYSWDRYARELCAQYAALVSGGSGSSGGLS